MFRLPASAACTDRSPLSVGALALKRMTHETPGEQCEDPLVNSKYLELSLNRWKQLTPKRLSYLTQGEGSGLQASNMEADYHQYR